MPGFLWVLGVLAAAVYFVTRIFNRLSYWKRNGVPQGRPLPVIGDSRPWSLPVWDLYVKTYNENRSEPYFGLYELSGRKLLLRDPEIVRKLIIRDFNHFTDRSSLDHSWMDPLDRGLFMMREPDWRPQRNKLSPAFTSGKLKWMFNLMLESASMLASHIENKSEVEARELMFTMATDVTASCAFGLDVRSNPRDSKTFREMAMKAFKVTYKRVLGFMLIGIWPWAAARLKLSFSTNDVLEYFRQVIQQTLSFRRKNDFKRDDFVQLLLQLGEKGSIEYSPAARDADDDYLGINNERQPSKTVKIDDEVLGAHAYTFLTAGSEPLANTMTFAAFELAKNQELQERVRQEVNRKMAHHGGLTYQAIQEMNLLDLCIQETLRMYPVTKNLLRLCTRQYTLQDYNLVLEKGTKVVVPLMGLHYDPQYFPEPHLFNPERFLHPPIPGTYLPFGEGPRMCIGMRFAMVEMKVGLSMILHRYRLMPITEKIELNKWSFLNVPKHDVYISFDKIHTQDCTQCPRI